MIPVHYCLSQGLLIETLKWILRVASNHNWRIQFSNLNVCNLLEAVIWVVVRKVEKGLGIVDMESGFSGISILPQHPLSRQSWVPMILLCCLNVSLERISNSGFLEGLGEDWAVTVRMKDNKDNHMNRGKGSLWRSDGLDRSQHVVDVFPGYLVTSLGVASLFPLYQ